MKAVAVKCQCLCRVEGLGGSAPRGLRAGPGRLECGVWSDCRVAFVECSTDTD